MKAQIAFYKAKGNIIDKAIRLWTRSKYSHCEIIIGESWYSSSPRDNGVRGKQIIDDGTSWDIINVDISLDSFNNTYFKYRNGGYDFVGIFLCMVIPLKRDSKRKVTCSEFCAEVLGFSEPKMYSPERLYRRLINGKFK